MTHTPGAATCSPTLASKIGDLARFGSPRKLIGYAAWPRRHTDHNHGLRSNRAVDTKATLDEKAGARWRACL